MGELRESKKRETRQRISDVATELFYARGFEAVTVDEIAAAAKVSKMTVFNYFARKEELLLDREDDLKLLPLRNAVRERKKGQSPLAAMRALVEKLRDEKHPLLHLDSGAVHWWRIIAASPSLQARLRELSDEATELLAAELGGGASARLFAGIVVLTVRTARAEAVRVLESGGSARKANAEFSRLLELGFDAAGHTGVTTHR
ncbi:MAG: TetR/AcrR family transcriptional regulator [Archangium sp.]